MVPNPKFSAKRAWGAKGRHGMALTGAMAVLLIVVSVALVGMVSVTGNSRSGGVAGEASFGVRSASIQRENQAALNLAEAGVVRTLHWLGKQTIPPSWTAAQAPELAEGSLVGIRRRVAIADGHFLVTMYPSTTNPNANLRSYLIESIGQVNGRREIVRAYATQTSFSRYAMFTNQPGEGFLVGRNSVTKFNGPVHINNVPVGGAEPKPIKILWYTTGGSRIFDYDGPDAFTISSPDTSIKWYQNGVGGVGNETPATSNHWNRVVRGGEIAVRTDVPEVKMPTSTRKQMNAALGLPANTVNPQLSAPTSHGVTIPLAGGATKGGVFIHGDVNDMHLSTSGPSNINQIILVKQTNPATGGLKATTVTLNAETNQTQVSVTETPAGGGTPSTTNYSVPGLTNGVVYFDGNVGTQTEPKTGGVSGWVANSKVESGLITHNSALTIVTDATKNLNIDGNIRLRSDPVGTAAQRLRAGRLGIVSKTVQIVERYNSSPDPIRNVQVFATVMAFDTFDAVNPNNRPTGSFMLFGGYIANKVGRFGITNALNGNMLKGFRRILNYDARVAGNPPPYFPSTGNAYVIASWQRVASTLQP